MSLVGMKLVSLHQEGGQVWEQVTLGGINIQQVPQYGQKKLLCQTSSKDLQRAFTPGLPKFCGGIKESFPCMAYPCCCFLCYINWFYYLL